MNVAENLLLQQMQGIANMPQTSSTPKKDSSGSFQDLMDQAGQETTVETGKDNAPAGQKPAQKDSDQASTADTEAKPVQKTEKETSEIDPNAAIYALDLFRPEIVDVSQPEEAVLTAAPVVEAAAESTPAAAEPEMVLEAVPETAAEPTEEPAAAVPVEEAPLEMAEVQPDAPKAEVVQETVRPAEVRETAEPAGLQTPQESSEISDTGEIRSVQPEESSEDAAAEDLSGQVTQMNQPVFQEVKAAPVKVADPYGTVDAQDPDLETKLAVDIMQAAENGTEQIQIRLSPANLGAITIDLAKDVNGALQVVIHASNSRAAGLLSQHLDGLHTALQSHGTEQTVQVEVQRAQEGQEQHMFQHADPDGRGQQQRQQEERRQENKDSGEDFLQKLRLGLTGMEE